MKILTTLAVGLGLSFAAGQASAWSQPTHKNIVKDALAYMNSAQATTQMRRAYQFYVTAAGSEARAGEILGQAAYDVDDFQDTRLGGWWVGYEHAPVAGAAASLVNYTSYWHFINMARQEPVIKKLLPLQVMDGAGRVQDFQATHHGPAATYLYEPDEMAILDEIIPRFTALQVYQAILESLASEHAARMVAMKNATDSATALADALQLEYNKVRQQGITNEILDIVGGAEALGSS
jgi:hypothetical protein